MRSWTPKAKRRPQKPFTSGLTPADIVELRAKLERAMSLTHGVKVGRPSLATQKALAKLRVARNEADE